MLGTIMVLCACAIGAGVARLIQLANKGKAKVTHVLTPSDAAKKRRAIQCGRKCQHGCAK